MLPADSAQVDWLLASVECVCAIVFVSIGYPSSYCSVSHVLLCVFV